MCCAADGAQAPSFRLSAYLDQRCKRVLRAQDATLPGTLHDAVLALRSAVLDAAAALSGMRAAAAAVSDAVLLTPPQSASQQQMQQQQQEQLLVSHDPGDQQQQQQEQLLECQDGGEGGQMSTPDDGREQLSGEELVLLLEGSMSGMAKDLQWMVRCCCRRLSPPPPSFPWLHPLTPPLLSPSAALRRQKSAAEFVVFCVCCLHCVAAPGRIGGHGRERGNWHSD